ncbi:tetratricopeptide repeat protein [Fulvivirga sp. 29W222]|uniref:histidine kinase n=1 Tax=Fulvivirga marina TaxID=2494733 RepID=A0A937G085_9BACT|nr:ATP-binding protein [Fulvivirga marina]MBL6447600.1 tetratricopeptide repeat protein [Fulvivirga marina]
MHKMFFTKTFLHVLPILFLWTSVYCKSENKVDSLYYDATLSLLEQTFYAYLERGDKDIIPVILGGLGDVNEPKRHDVQLIYSLQEALKVYKESGDKQGILAILSGIAKDHKFETNYNEVLKYFEKSLKVSEGLNDTRRMSLIQTTIGVIEDNRGNYSAAASYYRSGLESQLLYDDKKKLAFSSSKLGHIHLKQGKEDSAFYYFNQAFATAQKMQYFKFIRSETEHIGSWYMSRMQFSKALDFYYKSLKSFDELNDTLGIAKLYGLIADTYRAKGNHEKSFYYQQKALQHYQHIGYSAGTAKIQHSIGTLLKKAGDYQKSKKYFFQALKSYTLLKDSCSFSTCFLNIANVHLALSQTDSAFHYLIKAQRQADKCKDISVLAEVYIEMGKLRLGQNQPKRALMHFEQAMIYADSVQNRSSLKTVASFLYPMYKQQGQLEKAFAAFNIFHVNNDSLFNATKSMMLIQKEMEYAFEKENQEKQIAQQQKDTELMKALEKQRRLIYLIINVLLAMLAISAAFYYNFNNKKQANAILHKQNKEIAHQKTELEKLSHVKSRFFINISHELRTPLTLISSPVQSLLNSTGNKFKPSTLNTLQLVERNSKHLEGLVNDILDLSKLKCNKLEVQNEAVAIKPLLEWIGSNFESLSSHLGVLYSTCFDQLPDGWLKLDALKFEKILNNLLSNALKHTPPEGEIQIIASKENDRMLIRVSDTGHGIASTDLPYIFERFYQGQQPDAPLQGGTGIGLALARELTKLMGGELTVKSEVGKGSTFTLNLPYVTADPSTSKNIILNGEEESTNMANSTSLITTDKKSQNILIVEDNTDMQQFIRGLLNDKYTTHLATNGKVALQTLQNHEIDLIITDIMMPEMDGHTLLKHLKNSDLHRNIPVIVLTALNYEDSKLEALINGVDDYLTKPFSSAELLARTHNLLTRYKVRKERTNEVLVAIEHDISGEKEENDIIPISRYDVTWIQQVESIIRQEIENKEFKISKLADQFHLSERQFRRRINRITGLSPKKYQQEIALQMARELLEMRRYNNVTAVAYSVGIDHVTRFSKLYESRFGKTPHAYFE